jgi:hypothetical protein
MEDSIPFWWPLVTCATQLLSFPPPLISGAIPWAPKLFGASVRNLRVRYQEAEMKGCACTDSKMPGTSLAIPSTALSVPLALVVTLLPFALWLAALLRIAAMREAMRGAVITSASRSAATDFRVLQSFRWLIGHPLGRLEKIGRIAWLGVLMVGPYVAWLYVAGMFSAESTEVAGIELPTGWNQLSFLIVSVVIECCFLFWAYAPFCRTMTPPPADLNELRS